MVTTYIRLELKYPWATTNICFTSINNHNPESQAYGCNSQTTYTQVPVFVHNGKNTEIEGIWTTSSYGMH